jgi:hypothetical protein
LVGKTKSIRHSFLVTVFAIEVKEDFPFYASYGKGGHYAAK